MPACTSGTWCFLGYSCGKDPLPHHHYTCLLQVPHLTESLLHGCLLFPAAILKLVKWSLPQWSLVSPVLIRWGHKCVWETTTVMFMKGLEVLAQAINNLGSSADSLPSCCFFVVGFLTLPFLGVQNLNQFQVWVMKAKWCFEVFFNHQTWKLLIRWVNVPWHFYSTATEPHFPFDAPDFLAPFQAVGALVRRCCPSSLEGVVPAT